MGNVFEKVLKYLAEPVKLDSEKKSTPRLFKYVLPICLVVVFIIRLLSYITKATEPIGLDQSPLDGKFLTIITLLSIWLNYVALLVVMMRGFYSLRILRLLTKYFAPFVFWLNLILLKPTLIILQGNANFSLLNVLLIVELALGSAISIFYWHIEGLDKLKWKEVFKTFGLLLLMMIPAMPPYFLQFVFGDAKASLLILDFTFTHRIFLYFGFIIPVLLFICLRKKPQEVKHFTLTYICVAAAIVFMVDYNYTHLTKPWTWPFHLCNTAVFIIPICLIFRAKNLFFFTYFINVVGALIAMLMPNYDEMSDIFSSDIVVFWSNHYLAFFMPVLTTLLGVFERPRLKQFIRAMCWFLAYFTLVMTINIVFPAVFNQDVDFFFLNGDHIVLNVLENVQFVRKLYDVRLTLNIPLLGWSFSVRPIYQGIFFLVYIGIALGVWFIYEEGYRVVDRLVKLKDDLDVIKLDEFAFQAQLNGKDIELPMNENAGIKYELQHFSKKYGNNKHYSVQDANLEVYGGEIFGFLGPNGAGKSTIIKSTVGIQSITDGHIQICGYDVTRQPVMAKRQIGFVPDHYALYENLTGREYINYIADIYEVSKKDRDERIEKYIKLFELENKIDNKIETYSHGMKQKITIMSALVHNPKVWILDEPLTGLDPNSIFQVKECMKQHASEGNIVFFSSHIIDIVEKLCQRIAIIKSGHIQCVKTVQEIEESGMTLEEFYLQTIEDKEVNN